LPLSPDAGPRSSLPQAVLAESTATEIEQHRWAAVRDAIAWESQVVAEQKRALDDVCHDFARQVASEHATIFITGVGKSNLVAQLLASTWASIGIRAVHLAAIDVLHGELGLIRADDIVLCLSNSGRTEEVTAVARAVRRKGARVAAMVGRAPSPLSQLADWVIQPVIGREATGVELPTASVMAMIAVGHAVAVYAIQARNVSAGDFGRLHPGGMLGVLIGSTVDEIMQRLSDVPTVSPETAMSEVVIRMTAHPIGAAVVVDAHTRLLGIITDGDIRRGIEERPDGFLSCAAAECMNSSPITCAPKSSVLDALRLMEEGPRKVYVLPVVDTGRRVEGVIRAHDVLGLELRRPVR
jgi:arabinose-5-phosphate isomerase